MSSRKVLWKGNLGISEIQVIARDTGISELHFISSSRYKEGRKVFVFVFVFFFPVSCLSVFDTCEK